MIGYTTKILETFKLSPGGWKGQRVGIFLVSPEGEEQIGEYTRNYDVFYKTFFPFKKDDKDYALYSPHYTATRVMELPSCKDIGGEEPHGGGFCPVTTALQLARTAEHSRSDPPRRVPPQVCGYNLIDYDLDHNCPSWPTASGVKEPKFTIAL